MTVSQTRADPAPDHDFQLADRYAPGRRPVVLTGVQAIARALIEQRAADRAAGRRTATFVSGYQGSPLAGLDTLLKSIPGLREEHQIQLQPGVNEELAATSVWGSQLTLPGDSRTVDGVVGVWYGKGPGLDRATDAIRHGSMYGTDPRGGVVAFVGDDPAAKSSTLPFTSDATLAALNMPFFTPRNGEEVVLYTLAAVELSRATGCWVGVKILADVADGLWTLDRDFSGQRFVVPALQWAGQPWTYRQRTVRTPGESTLAETDLHGPRWAMVEAFLAANQLDEISGSGPARFGVIGSGTAYDAAVQALEDLGLDAAARAGHGIRLMRVAAPYPLARERVARFAGTLDELLVVEEKGPFLERQVKDILYDLPARPRVYGKRDSRGAALVPADGELVAGRLHGPLRRLLGEHVDLARPATVPLALEILPTQRTPYFCSGCPHNRSTVVPAGSLAGGGIGCHTLASISARPDSAITGWTQMGGEGAQWIGQAPFSTVGHIFQNVGDGTFFHSGQLAVQAAMAAGVSITYKVLYNSAVAMTGAQDPQGGLPVPDLARKLLAEGVRRIIICADEPGRYRGARLPGGVLVWPRERLDEAQRVLREISGVTVLVYDQQCAANARRLRKRGRQPVRPQRVVISQEVCEGCGDCGVKSNCLSVQPVETELGRKTAIEQTSCNTDYSCLDGDCPSFVTLTTRSGDRADNSKKRSLPEPPPVPDVAVERADTDVFLAGVGGTGIVTVNQVLATAALRAGYQVEGLDQTGLSQKAGPVVSHLRLATDRLQPANRVGAGAADLFLAFDLLVAADPANAGYADAGRTTVIASTARTPTGDMVADPDVAYPDEAALLGRLAGRSRALLSVDALRVAGTLFGSTTAANFLLIGMAFQTGRLPVPPDQIEAAIGLNGVAVAANVAAFRWGRALAADPGCVELPPAAEDIRPPSAEVERRITAAGLDGETGRLVTVRAARLEAFQDQRLALAYVDEVAAVRAAERAVGPRTELSQAVARYLFKLLAYKDEYEVARLLTDPAFIAAAEAQVPGGSRLTYRLHPPVLRAMGLRRKIGLGPWARPFLRTLARGKALRGTRLDPFGYTSIRRLERRLAEDYRQRVRALTGGLRPEDYDRAVAIAELPDLVRGYESVKLRNVRAYEERLHELTAAAR